MRTGLALCVAVAALSLSACRAPITVNATFDARAAEEALKPGSNTIQGSVFRRKLNGSVTTGAGEVVYLVPATAYAEARIAALYPQGKIRTVNAQPVEAAPADYERLTRETKADRKGDFTFERVRPGRYFIATRLIWFEPRFADPLGGQIYERVEVRGENQTVSVILSGN
jgi:hypothetical protein